MSVKGDNISANKRIAKNSIYLAVRMLITTCVALYTSRVLLSVLGIVDYGVYNVVCGFVIMFAFLNNAMVTGVQRFYNYELGCNGIDGANHVFITSVYTQFILAVVVVVLTETIGLWYMYHKMVIPPERFSAALWIFQFAVISLVMNIMSAPYAAAVMAHEEMKFYALVSLLDSVIKLLIAIVLPFIFTDKLVAYGFLILLLNVIIFFTYYFFARFKFEEIRFKFVFYKKLFWELLTFSSWNLFGKFAVMVKEQGLNMILNLFYGPIVNAARAIAFQINGALTGFVSSVSVAVKPQLTQSYAQGDKVRTFHLMNSMSKLCYIVLLLFAIPLCVEIDYLLAIWLGANVPEYTNVFVILVVITLFVNNLNAPVSYVVHATGKMKKYQIVTSSIELIMLPVSYIILSFGAEPWIVFFVAFVFVTIGQVASLYILRSIEYFSIRDYFRQIIIPLSLVTLVSLLSALLIKYLLTEGFLRLLLVALVSIAVIALMTYSVCLNVSEKSIVKNFITSKLSFKKNSLYE